MKRKIIKYKWFIISYEPTKKTPSKINLDVFDNPDEEKIINELIYINNARNVEIWKEKKK